MFDGRCFVRLDSHVSNMFDAGMRTTPAQRLVAIVLSVFDQSCFNRLATHFNISMFGDQTMFDGIWSPNIIVCPGDKRWLCKCSGAERVGLWRLKWLFFCLTSVLVIFRHNTVSNLSKIRFV